MARALISVPQTAKRGDVIEIKTLVAHPMETGYRRDSSGGAIPRDIINKFTCSYNGEEIFRADLFPAVAANPFFAFTTIATASGVLEFRWTDDRGETQTESRTITVE
jgi:sulfur-oxidizing protein SoxZ